MNLSLNEEGRTLISGPKNRLTVGPISKQCGCQCVQLTAAFLCAPSWCHAQTQRHIFPYGMATGINCELHKLHQLNCRKLTTSIPYDSFLTYTTGPCNRYLPTYHDFKYFYFEQQFNKITTLSAS